MNDSDIRELFDKAVRVSGAAGAQLSIVRDGRQYDYAHGFANAELALPMTHDTAIQIGSVTKVFNAVMIMSLVEEGKLALDEPVIRYLPEFELADRNAARTITLRHLLSMSSGIDNGDYGDYGVGEDAVARRVAALKTLPQHFAPGAYFGYSNAGTDISGYVAERVTGRIWDDLIKERVFQPAALKDAATLDRDRFFQRVSVGHERDPQDGSIKVTRPWGMSRGMAPAGATLTSSAHDLARFGKLFIDAGIADSGSRVLSENSVKTMMTPQIPTPAHYYAKAWCLGPCMNEWGGAALWGHPGGNVSGMSYLYWLPEQNGVIAWIVNSRFAMPRFNKVMMLEVMRAAFEVVKPVIEAPASPLGIDPARYVGTYEALDGKRVVDVLDGKLVMTESWRDFINPSVNITTTLSLTPLGDDRFLLDQGSACDPLVLSEDVAFFGDDGHGHVSNILAGLFPCSRKS